MSTVPRKKAVAIEYNPDEAAPMVIAKGQGLIAERLLQQAREADVAQIQDEKLVSELYGIDISCYIPPELYEAVAQILVFVNELDLEYIKNQQDSKGASR